MIKVSFSAEVAECLKDTPASSNVKAGVNRTNSHRFSLTPALSLLEFHISPALLPHMSGTSMSNSRPACLVYLARVRLESCTGLRCRFEPLGVAQPPLTYPPLRGAPTPASSL